jgi:hypothetical protein
MPSNGSPKPPFGRAERPTPPILQQPASADKGSEPWIYYISPDFCAHCIETIDGIMEGVGRYLKKPQSVIWRKAFHGRHGD